MDPADPQSPSCSRALRRVVLVLFIASGVIGFGVGGIISGVKEDPDFRLNTSTLLLEIQWALEDGDPFSVISALDENWEQIKADPRAVRDAMSDLRLARRIEVNETSPSCDR